MFLRELRIKNIKCFSDLSLTFPPRANGAWYVILGENGTGKSTLLRAIALSLSGKLAWSRLLEHPETWVRAAAPNGLCTAAFSAQDEQARQPFSTVEIEFPAEASGEGDEYGIRYRTPSFVEYTRPRNETEPFLVAGYGAFRRMESGGREQVVRGRRSNAFRTLFSDEVGLPHLAEWLLRIDYLSKDRDATRSAAARERLKSRLQAIIEVVNGLLPEEGPFRLQGVSANGVLFSGADGEGISLENMSDGYRTMFALAVDLLRLFERQNGAISFDSMVKRSADGRVYVDVDGIVLIDEIDAHLHPKWLQEVGGYLQRTFPNVQFIVASHSPFVAQSATENGLFVLRRSPDSADVSVEVMDSVHGLAAEELLISPAFGLESTRDPATETLLDEYTRLTALKERGQLPEAEQGRLAELAQRLAPVVQLDQAVSEALWHRLKGDRKP